MLSGHCALGLLSEDQRAMFSRVRILRHYLTRAPQKLIPLAALIWRTKIRSAKTARQHPGQEKLPALITLQINRACNLRCVQCWEWGESGVYNKMTADEIKEELPTADWEKFIAEISAWKPYVYFFGGEPLLRKDMMQLIRFASSKGVLTAINSNMTLVTEDLAREMVESGIDYVIASLDGPEEVNNRIRRGPDSFGRAVRGIKNLLSARGKARSALPLVELCTTLTAENYEHLSEIADIAQTLGVDIFKIQYGMFTTRDLLERTKIRLEHFNAGDLRLFQGYLRDTSGINPDIVEQQESLIKGRKRLFSFQRYPKSRIRDLTARKFFSSIDTAFGEGLCHVPWKRAVIMPNGDVVGCPWFPEVCAGNIREQSLPEIWQSKQMEQFRHELRTNGLFPACSRCCDLYELDETPLLGVAQLLPAIKAGVCRRLSCLLFSSHKLTM
jgi:radical SAM protein with 4Fe4S-binding SPASM domain